MTVKSPKARHANHLDSDLKIKNWKSEGKKTLMRVTWFTKWLHESSTPKLLFYATLGFALEPTTVSPTRPWTQKMQPQ